MKKFHVAVSTNCVTIVEVEAKTAGEARSLVMEGEYLDSDVRDVRHNDHEISGTQEIKS